jgi:hypothetical protein
MFIPEKSSHAPADAVATKLAHDKELMDIMCTNIAQPLAARSDEREACDRVANPSQVGIILFLPDAVTDPTTSALDLTDAITTSESGSSGNSATDVGYKDNDNGSNQGVV